MRMGTFVGHLWCGSTHIGTSREAARLSRDTPAWQTRYQIADAVQCATVPRHFLSPIYCFSVVKALGGARKQRAMVPINF